MAKVKIYNLAVFALSLLQVFHAKAEGMSEHQQQEYFADLAERGYIQSSQAGGYEIDFEKLQPLRERENFGDLDAHQTLNMLQSLIGDETNIRAVEMHSIVLGSQDVAQ